MSSICTGRIGSAGTVDRNCGSEQLYAVCLLELWTGTVGWNCGLELWTGAAIYDLPAGTVDRNCGPEHLYLTCLRGLSFLTTWQLQDSSCMVAQSTKGKYSALSRRCTWASVGIRQWGSRRVIPLDSPGERSHALTQIQKESSCSTAQRLQKEGR